MGDLATILGVQLQQKLDEINQALGVPHQQGYLTPRKGGQAAHDTRGGEPAQPAPTPPAAKSSRGPRGRNVAIGYDPSVEQALPDAATVSRNGYGELAQGSSRPVVSYLPPEGGDRIVEPPPPQRGRTLLLQQQVPVMNEKGQQVDVVGPKGAGFLQTAPEPEGQLLPNADPGDLERSRMPYLTPPDGKSKGVFVKHMKSMYEQMLQQMGTPV